MTTTSKVLLVLAVILLALAATHLLLLVHWAYTFAGVNGSAPWGTFWGDFGSDIGELAIVGGLFGMIRQHNCEVKGCIRLGRHTTAAGHKVCRKHHPDDSLSAQDVLVAHEEAKNISAAGLDAEQPDT